MNEQAIPPKNSTGSIVAAVVVFSFAYAILRDHIAGPVEWTDFPFFIFNKATSLAAFILLTLNFGFGPLKNLGAPVPAGWLNARIESGDN